MNQKKVEPIKFLAKKYSVKKSITHEELVGDFKKLINIVNNFIEEDEEIIVSPKILNKFFGSLFISLIFLAALAFSSFLIYSLVSIITKNLFNLYQTTSNDGKLSIISNIIVAILSTAGGIFIDRKIRK